MYTQNELLAAIDEMHEAKHTVTNCEKLAAMYTVLDHLTNIDSGYSADSKPLKENLVAVGDYIPEYGESEFLKAIEGKKPKDMWMLMDELMATLSLVNSALYHSVMSRIDN